MTTGTPGGENYTTPIPNLQVCNPKPPVCGPNGWLVEQTQSIEGVDCAESTPTPEQLQVKAAPNCDPEPAPESVVETVVESGGDVAASDAGPAPDTGGGADAAANAEAGGGDITQLTGGGCEATPDAPSVPVTLILLASVWALALRRRGA